jgi:hypothetical protein
LAKCLFDENLPPRVAAAPRLRASPGGPPSPPRGLAEIGFDVVPIGDPPAPPRGSSDADNVAWCRKNDAVLFTIDRGRKDREILEVLRRFPDANVVFVPDGMTGPELSQNFHKRIGTIDDLLQRGRRVRKKITRNGGFRDA